MNKLLFFNRINDRSEVALCMELHLRGYQISIIGEPEDSSLQTFEEIGIPVKRIKFKSRLDFNSIARLKRYLKANYFDMIYCPPARCLTALMLSNPPRTTRIISYRGSLTEIKKYNPIDRLTQFSNKLNAIICNSKAVARRLEDYGINASKIYQVYKGHDISWYDVEPTSEFENLKYVRDKFILGYVANIRSNKGGNLLLEAIAKLKKMNIPVHLVQLGNIFDDEFSKKIKVLGLTEDVSLLGFKSDAIKWYKHFDLVIMPSTDGESFSRSIVEAMSQKVPVLSSNVGGMTELIQDQQNGLIFDRNSLDDLSSKIKFAYENPKHLNRMKELAYLDIKQKYNIQQYVDGCEAVFTDM